jgi:outer membrane protein OmpA-like peptidoglycan-associated protein
MTVAVKPSLNQSLQSAAAQANLAVQSSAAGSGPKGEPTAVFQLALSGATAGSPSLRLELTEGFDFDKPSLLPEMNAYLAAEAKRLRNPRPDGYVTLDGLPVSFGQFQWPFHRSTSGADTYIVHG